MRFTQEISVFNPYAINDAVVSLGTSITQTAEEIRLEATKTYASKTELTSTFSQTATSFAFTLSQDSDTKASLSMQYTRGDGSVVSLAAQSINFDGFVTFTNLETSGQTTINGGNITTGTISLDRISGTSGTLTIDSNRLLIKSGTIGIGTADAANRWTIGGINSSTDKRAWIYSGNKSTLSSKNAGIYIGTDGIEVREGSGAANSWTRIIGGVTETTKITVYDGGGTRYGNMVISDENRHLPSHTDSQGRYDYYRIGFTNGIVTGSSGENRGANVFLNETFLYNSISARRDVFFGDSDEPGSSSYGTFRLYQNGMYYASWSKGSDKRLKKNISRINRNKARDFILALKPSEYQLVHVKDGRYHHGFIAQEVEEIGWDGLVGHDEQNDNMRSLEYTEIIADIVAVLQELLAEREGIWINQSR